MKTYLLEISYGKFLDENWIKSTTSKREIDKEIKICLNNEHCKGLVLHEVIKTTILK